jgi:multimeric flavodoxin WrbA
MNNKNCAFTKQATDVLGKFLSFFPEISRSFHKARILQAIGIATVDDTARAVTQEDVIKAVSLLFPTFETFTLAIQDPAHLSSTIAAQKNLDTAAPLIHINRWPDKPKAQAVAKSEDVFAFLASPRSAGNTQCLMNAALDGVRKEGARIEMLNFSQLAIKPCTGCLACKSEKLVGFCSIQDDMEYIYNRFLACDAFVLGFPIYSGRESSHLTVFLDRLFALSDPWKKKDMKKRHGMIIATWGWPSPEIYAPVIHNIAFILKHFGIETTEVVTGCGFWDACYAQGTAGLFSDKLEVAREAGRSFVVS